MDAKNNVNFMPSNQQNSDEEIKVYRKRWVILTIYMYYAAINAIQCNEYAIITNIVMRYYNVTETVVEWSSIIFMALYAPLVIPASYIIDKKGLRVAALIGGLGTALGTTIKVLSIREDLFFVVLIGQGILAASQIVIICLPPLIAAVWFKPSEISTACGLGVFGTQLGSAIGFAFPSILVKNHANTKDIGSDFKFLTLIQTALIIPVVLTVTLYFPAQPKTPPSLTRIKEIKNKKFKGSGFFDSLKTLLNNIPFVAHVVAYGINIAVLSGVGTLLNHFILQYFSNAEEDVGRMGLVMVVFGMIGSIIFGIILDKTHKYKETAVSIYFLSGFTIAGYMFALEMKSKVLVYIALASVGLFTSAYMPVGFEFAMELTFPTPEGTTAGILMAPSQLMGVIFTLVLSKLNTTVGPFWALSSQVVMLCLGTMITILIPNNLRRQKAFNKSTCNVEGMPLKQKN